MFEGCPMMGTIAPAPALVITIFPIPPPHLFGGGGFSLLWKIRFQPSSVSKTYLDP